MPEGDGVSSEVDCLATSQLQLWGSRGMEDSELVGKQVVIAHPNYQIVLAHPFPFHIPLKLLFEWLELEGVFLQ